MDIRREETVLKAKSKNEAKQRKKRKHDVLKKGPIHVSVPFDKCLCLECACAICINANRMEPLVEQNTGNSLAFLSEERSGIIVGKGW